MGQKKKRAPILVKKNVIVSSTSSAMAEIDDGPHGARTLHNGSTINVNFIKPYSYVIPKH